MASDKSTALAKIASIKSSLINAIIELEAQVEAARQKGDDALSRALTQRSTDLARESLRLHEVAAKMRGQTSLAPAIAKLDAIAREARDALNDLRKVADALAIATRLVGILSKLLTVLP